MSVDTQERLNAATDARTNLSPPPLQGVSDLAALRQRWADMPMIPRVLHSRGEGVDNSWAGFDVRTLLIGEESGGRFTFHDIIIAPGAGLPAHHLDDVDTYWRVVEGELELTVGAVTQTGRKGAFAFAPMSTTQAIVNQSDAPAHVILWYSPAGSERAFAAAHDLWISDPAVSPQAAQEVLAKFGYVFHQGGERLDNDARVGQSPSRLEASIEQFDDLAALRNGWAQRPRFPKLVHDRTLMQDIPMTGQDTRILLTGDENGGQAVVFDLIVDPSYMAPPHHQPSEEEIFLMFEGALNLTIGNESTQIQAGGFGFAPRFGTHGFQVPPDQIGTTHCMTINSPAGHERGFEMIVREGASERLPDLLVAHGWQLHEEYAPG